MKTIIVVLAVLAVPVVIGESSINEPQVTDTIRICQNETGVLQEHMDQLEAGERVDNPELRAYVLCVFKREDYISDNGILQTDKLRKEWNSANGNEITQEMVTDCVKQQNTPELTAYETALCAWKKIKNFRKELRIYPITDCQDKTGVSKEHMDQLRNGERSDRPDIRAYVLCVFKKLDYINDNGILQTDKFRKEWNKMFSNEDTERIIKECVKQQDTPELTAYETALCGWREIKKLRS